MRTPRALVLTAAVTALAVAAPVTLAESAQAAPAFSVSVEHCNGGIAVVGYSNLVKAVKAEARIVARQVAHPKTLRSVQLRKGSKLIKVSLKHC